jgi:hypothetical protein
MKNLVSETSLLGSSLIDYLFLQNNKVWRGIGALHNFFYTALIHLHFPTLRIWIKMESTYAKKFVRDR